MKVLTTSVAAQEMRIIPRSYPSFITVKLRNESTNEIDTYEDVPATTSNGYLSFEVIYDLQEAFTYELTIFEGSSVIYKDKIFCTDQDIAIYSVNVDTVTWDNSDQIWNLTEVTWEEGITADQYVPETSYDNDFIII